MLDVLEMIQKATEKFQGKVIGRQHNEAMGDIHEALKLMWRLSCKTFLSRIRKSLGLFPEGWKGGDKLKDLVTIS